MAIMLSLALWLRTPVQASPFLPFATCWSHDHTEGSDFTSQYFITSLTFCLERPRQQAIDCLIDGCLAGQNCRHGLCHRHIDALRCRKLDQHRRREFTLGKFV